MTVGWGAGRLIPVHLGHKEGILEVICTVKYTMYKYVIMQHLKPASGLKCSPVCADRPRRTTLKNPLKRRVNSPSGTVNSSPTESYIVAERAAPTIMISIRHRVGRNHWDAT